MYNDNEKLVDQYRLCIKCNEIQHLYHRNCGLYVYKADFILIEPSYPFYILYDKDLYNISYKVGATMNKFLASAYSKLLFESFVDISTPEMH